MGADTRPGEVGVELRVAVPRGEVVDEKPGIPRGGQGVDRPAGGTGRARQIAGSLRFVLPEFERRTLPDPTARVELGAGWWHRRLTGR